MRFIELFAGIGGFRLGLEPLGWQCVWANENDPYACNVYRKNFGDKELYEGDIRRVDPNIIPEFDMLTAGFPCQDISNAGKREGIKEGNRSGLWFEIVRIIRSRSPRWIFLENVAALTVRGLDIVLRDLSESGYYAQWDHIPASAFSAPHRRDRIWIIANSNSIEYSKSRTSKFWQEPQKLDRSNLRNYWNNKVPSDFIRMDDGLSNRMDRLRCLGNAVVPQVVTHIGRCIQMSIDNYNKEMNNGR